MLLPAVELPPVRLAAVGLDPFDKEVPKVVFEVTVIEEPCDEDCKTRGEELEECCEAVLGALTEVAEVRRLPLMLPDDMPVYMFVGMEPRRELPKDTLKLPPAV